MIIRTHQVLIYAVLGLATAAVLPAESGPTRSATERRTEPPAYYRDDRLTTRLKMPARVTTGEALLDTVKEQAQIRLVMEERWGKGALAGTVRDLPAAYLMDALERLYAGHWFHVREHWTLANSRTAGELASRAAWKRVASEPGLSEHNWAEARREFDFILSLTPTQWTRLEQGEKLWPKDLSPGQWAHFRSILMLYASDPRGPNNETPRPLAFSGEKVYLSLSTAGDFSPAGLLYCHWPGLDPAEDAFWKTGTGLDWHDGRRVPEALAKRARERGGALTFEGIKEPEAEGTDYRRDPRFKEKLKLDPANRDWTALLRALDEATRTSFLMQGSWLKKPVPFAAGGRAASEVMSEIARVGEGEWREVGRVWVLAPKARS